MTNKVYINPETARTWSDAVTSSDELLDLGGLAADDVSGMGSYWDLGAGARSEWYEVEFHIAGFDTAPVVGEFAAFFQHSQHASQVGICKFYLDIVIENLLGCM